MTVSQGRYLLILSDCCSPDYVILDKETFDWVKSDVIKGRDGDHISWRDETCPDNVREAVWKREGGVGSVPDGFYPNVMYSDYHDCKASLSCLAALHHFDFHSEFKKYMKQNNLTVIDIFKVNRIERRRYT